MKSIFEHRFSNHGTLGPWFPVLINRRCSITGSGSACDRTDLPKVDSNFVVNLDVSIRRDIGQQRHELQVTFNTSASRACG